LLAGEGGRKEGDCDQIEGGNSIFILVAETSFLHVWGGTPGVREEGGAREKE
jgi:hypothetical protein